MPAETSHHEQIMKEKQDGLPTVRCQHWLHTINQASTVRKLTFPYLAQPRLVCAAAGLVNNGT